MTCDDFYLFANTELIHEGNFFMRGEHLINIEVTGEDAISDLEKNGIESYMFCESMRDEILSLIQTIKAFAGGIGKHPDNKFIKPSVPEYMEKANVEFLKWSINWDMKERPIQKVEIDESLI